MRLRNVKGSREKIEVSDIVVKEPETYKGRWKDYFGNDNPIKIEIGMGKGSFIIKQAKIHPKINFIGIEKFSSVIVRAVERAQEETEDPASGETLANLCFLRFDAVDIQNIFDKDEVAGIYLNFSDPWPKERHAKRRLTSREFLKRYENMLERNGVIEFKTDNTDLFAFSLAQVKEEGWELLLEEWDLHHSRFLEGNVTTEYEEKFVAEGKPICKMVIRR